MGTEMRLQNQPSCESPLNVPRQVLMRTCSSTLAPKPVSGLGQGGDSEWPPPREQHCLYPQINVSVPAVPQPSTQWQLCLWVQVRGRKSSLSSSHPLSSSWGQGHTWLGLEGKATGHLAQSPACKPLKARMPLSAQSPEKEAVHLPSEKARAALCSGGQFLLRSTQLRALHLNLIFLPQGQCPQATKNTQRSLSLAVAWGLRGRERF